MKIISKFEDYYDFCGYICADEKTWPRVLNLSEAQPLRKGQSSQVIHRASVLANLNAAYKDKIGLGRVYYHTNCTNIERLNLSRKERQALKAARNKHDIDGKASFVIIGDKIFPFVTFRFSFKTFGDNSVQDKHIFAYDLKFAQKIIGTEESHWNKDIQNHFAGKQKEDLLKAVRNLTNEPIVIFSPYEDPLMSMPDNLRMLSGANINGVLKRVRFHEYMEPQFVMQEIDMWLNKIKTNETIIEFNNSHKIESHGFNKKTSFRHR
ncbi:MAG: hypothetical protein IBX55_00990 [Methyloprofundus sp.]|nr:hypothetical protein [Methyloprofundus sp.]